MIRRVQRGQIKGVREVDVVRLLQGGDLPAIVQAADDARDGQAGPLRHLVAPTPPDPPQVYDSYSAGDNSAAYCNDQDAPWTRADPLTVRRRKLAALLARLPRTVFAPFTKTAWTTTNPPAFCIGWPAPHRFVPVMPTRLTPDRRPGAAPVWRSHPTMTGDTSCAATPPS